MVVTKSYTRTVIPKRAWRGSGSGEMEKEEEAVEAAMELAKVEAEKFLEGQNEEDLHGHNGVQQRDRLVHEVSREM